MKNQSLINLQTALKIDYFTFKADGLKPDDLSLIFYEHGYSSGEQKPLFGYKFARAIYKKDEKIGLYLWGNDNDYEIYISVTGFAADAFYSFAKYRLAEHITQINRIDLAFDFADYSFFEFMQNKLLALAIKQNKKVSCFGDWHKEHKGRTFYFGSRQSLVYVRLYEKHDQLKIDNPLVRLEFEIKPQKKHEKIKLATINKYEMLDLKAVKDVLHLITRPRLQKLTLYKKQTIKHEETLMHLKKQYSKTFDRLLIDCSGSLEQAMISLITKN